MAAEPGVLISHPHGNANVREAALAFAEAGLLREFWTGVGWDPDAPLARFIPHALRRQLDRRAIPAELRSFVRLHPWREAMRLAADRVGLSIPMLSPNACHEDLDRHVARELDAAGDGIGAIYAYDHCALESFRAAARNGQRRFYDLPIGYWRALEATIHGERDAWPDWSALAPALDFQTPTFHRKDREIALAQRIIVPSRFVARSLEQHFMSPTAPVTVIPFGAPASIPLAEEELARGRSAPLRLLYVGGMDLRKGIPYLCEAIQVLGKSVSVTVVGRGGRSCEPLQRALVNTRRIDSLPRTEILALMRESDVFVFPTLFEGMALVVLEALSQGCAVITTPNSGAEDVIQDGRNGFLVAPRSADALVSAIQRLDADRDLLGAVRRAAQRVGEDWSWQRYRRSLIATVAGGAIP